MSSAGNLGRYWRTVRPLRGAQWYWRLRYRVLGRLAVPRAPWPAAAPPWDEAAAARLRELALLRAQLDPPAEGRIEDLRQGRFTYVNRTLETGGDPPWSAGDQPRLWRYHTHYGEEIRDLALHWIRRPADEDRRRVAGWMAAWTEGHGDPVGIGWEPYPVAARLMNWSLAAAAIGLEDPAFRMSLLRQARFLARRLEFDIQANHLLKDAAALVVAGGLVDEALRERGLSLLRAQVAEQILGDGGHYERCPMYHAQVMEDCLGAWVVLPEKPEWLTETISRMTRFLDQVRLGDGEIPFFGDSVLGQAMASEALIRLARDLCRIPEGARDGVVAGFKDSGFYVMGGAGGPGRLVARAGAPGPEHQLGHAHCDALSYEFSVGSRRILVNSGVHDYEDSDWRRYNRSTRAHNTVQVAGREQLEAWSIFRTGRRYRCVVHEWSPHGETVELKASHDGFAPYVHQRVFRYEPARSQWLVLDRVTGPGRFAVESFVHFHPDCSVELDDEGAVAHWPGGRLRITTAGFDALEVVSGCAEGRQGWYSPAFYVARAAPVLVLRKSVAGAAVFGYGIVNGSGVGSCRVEIDTALCSGDTFAH